MSDTAYPGELRNGDHIWRAGELVKVTSATYSARGSLVIVKGLRSDGSEFEARYVPGAVIKIARRSP
ncbi:glycine cleavage system aminomethyltransferase T [Catenulispora sp. GAS73]